MDDATPVAEAQTQDEPSAALPPYLIRREPVLDQNRGLSGYILKVLWAQPGEADPGAALIEAARTHGPSNFLAYAPHWVEGTEALIKNTFALSLPRNRCYVEFPETLQSTPEIIASLQHLAHAGLKFSIRGDLAAQAQHQAFVPFCKVVRFDPRLSTKADIFRQSGQHKQAGRLLMAVHTPDQTTLDHFLLLGFSLFQGGWPRTLVAAAALTPRQKTLLRLITLIMGEGEAPEIQACLQRDPELVKTLLDMVNTPAYGLSQPVESLSQAIMLLGRRQLQRWIQVLMYTESGRPAGYLSPTLIQASARAHFMEALSTLRHPEQTVRAEIAFTTGMLSIMDQLFHNSMNDLLSQVQVDVPVRDALLRREGLLGPDLRLATLIFPSDSDPQEDLAPLLQALGVNAEQLAPLIQDAFVWAHSITRAAP
ncbi:EAL and HDOD domain-containing protein [Castellaniella caeni]|uniref:EAL and HDOD domain-containing protein n=1 Tax=Castellaniella caeni TaxID=266123 RepID=UPI0008369E01|nr:HDOD domain-containing protein [Castellaniella caeni]